MGAATRQGILRFHVAGRPSRCEVGRAVRRGKGQGVVQGSSLGESSLCLSHSSSSLVSRSDWEMRSKAKAPVKRSS